MTPWEIARYAFEVVVVIAATGFAVDRLDRWNGGKG